MLVVFIIDRFNSLIVKDFTKKSFLKKILISVSNSLLNFIDRLISILILLYSYGGSSLTAEYRPVEPGEWVRFPPVALLNTILDLKTTKYINQDKTR